MKLVVDCKTGDKELYDLSSDIGESKNLAATMPDKVTEMSDTLSAYLSSVNAETYAVTPAKKKANAKNKAKVKAE